MRLHLEVLYKIWLRFKKKLQSVPNYKITGKNLLKNFYWALNANIKVDTDTITNEALMGLWWEHASVILNQITKINQGWHTQEADILANIFVIRAYVE